ncbi:MAG: hypothetical protein IJI66_02090 [Erysipelotrichaceae bacterium]|nr:hypothetical protein [Erysipelotrichaceae bacterium]
MRRRGGIGFFGFIIIMSLMEYIFEGGFGFLFLGVLMPLGFLGLFGYGIAKLFKALFPDTGEIRSTQSSQVKSNRSNSYVKSSKNAQIDRVLSDYFKNNVSLVIFDDIAISTQGGTYTTVDNLYLTHKDEKITQLKEFRQYYPGSYDKIISALAELAKKPNKLKKEEKKPQQKQENKEKKEKIDSFSDAEKFIDKINNLNKDLSNEEVTNGLYQTCDLLKQIDIVDREDGTVDPKLNKLYEYYLPILLGILENYKRLSEAAIKGEEYRQCEVQLVKTIKLINEALKTIYNSLHESEYMNLNADINTLQSLLKQDGLVESPFKGDK